MAGIIFDRFYFGQDDLLDITKHNKGLFKGTNIVSFENVNASDKIVLEENSIVEINGDLFVFSRTEAIALGTLYPFPYIVSVINNQDGTADISIFPKGSFVLNWDSEKGGYYSPFNPNQKVIMIFYPVNVTDKFYVNQVIIDKEIFWDE